MMLDDVATRQNLGESRGPESRSRARIYLSKLFFLWVLYPVKYHKLVTKR